MFFDDRRDVTTPGISEWEDFYSNYAQGKKAINFLMDSMFYSWHLFRLGHGRAHTHRTGARIRTHGKNGY